MSRQFQNQQLNFLERGIKAKVKTRAAAVHQEAIEEYLSKKKW